MAMRPTTVILYQRRAFDGTLESLATNMGDARRETFGAYDGFEIADRQGKVFVYIETQDERIAVMRRLTIRAQGEAANTAAIERCDAMLVMLWDGAGEIADLSLEFSYLESTVRGVTYYVNVRESNDDSFDDGAGYADLVPRTDEELAAKLAGVWQTPATELTITASGDLIYSTPGRILLTYKVEGGDLITDQPSKPNPVRTPISFGADGRLYSRDLGETAVYTRATVPRDPDAALSALIGFALHHGVGSASIGGAMSPFVVVEGADGTRQFVRFAGSAPDSELVVTTARDLARAGRLYAFAVDGYVTVDGVKSEAIIVEGGRPGRATSMKVALRYVQGPEGSAVPDGVQVGLPDGASWS